MKKLLLMSLILIIVSSGISFADDPNPASNVVTLGAAFVAVTIDHSTEGRSIGVGTSDGSAWVYSADLAGTIEIPVPAPGTLSFPCRKDANGVLFYAKASAGTPTLSIFIDLCQK